MSITFFNTLSRKMEDFVPINEKIEGKPCKVGLYTCGPTVHDFAHIGNFRTYVFEDLLRRFLEFSGYDVKHVMNITDVEDKTIRKAREQHKKLTDITDPLIEAFFADLDKLNIERAAVYPRATKHVERMVGMIRDLMNKGIAYRSDDGSIYYNIAKFEEYGNLAHINVNELRSGARVAQDEYEKDTASDFALWKAWDENDGEVYWDEYPDLGKGRPGWHIECSAMSTQYLGNHFDIHTGGVDNIFPHHQNEVAQSQATTGEKFVNYWLHSEHLQVEGKKMSKSLGNFFTLRDLLNKDANSSGKAWDPMAVRYLLASSHYRSRLDFTFKGLQTAEDTRNGLIDFLRRCREQQGDVEVTKELDELLDSSYKNFVDAMSADLNTPEALAVLFTVKRDVNKLIAKGTVGQKGAKKVEDLFSKFDRVLGLRLIESIDTANLLSGEEADLIEKRQQARKAKDYKAADQYRADLLQLGIVLEDTPKGLVWRRESPKN